ESKNKAVATILRIGLRVLRHHASHSMQNTGVTKTSRRLHFGYVWLQLKSTGAYFGERKPRRVSSRLTREGRLARTLAPPAQMTEVAEFPIKPFHFFGFVFFS